MAWRLYFLFGDLLACITVGAVSGWLTMAVVPDDWYLLAAMGAGMIVGMIVGMFGAILFTPLFGSLEIMLPAALSGMAAGAALGMIDNMAEIGWTHAVWGGGLVGLLCLFATYVVQINLRGEAT